MSADASKVVEALWVAWAQRDKAATLALVTDDIRFTLHIPPEIVPFGSTSSEPTIGKRALSDQLQTILDIFETIAYSGRVAGIVEGRVHGQVTYLFRHKLTGEEIEGVMRHVVHTIDGCISAIDEYHDVERIKAFMRLVASVAQRQT
jgi:ketosteroid isomerase-like protein